MRNKPRPTNSKPAKPDDVVVDPLVREKLSSLPYKKESLTVYLTPIESRHFFVEYVERPHGPPLLRIYKPIERWLRQVEERALSIYPAPSDRAPKDEHQYGLWQKARALLGHQKTVHAQWQGFGWPDLPTRARQALKKSGLQVLNPQLQFLYFVDCLEISFPGAHRHLPEKHVEKFVSLLDQMMDDDGWRWPADIPPLPWEDGQGQG